MEKIYDTDLFYIAAEANSKSTILNIVKYLNPADINKVEIVATVRYTVEDGICLQAKRLQDLVITYDEYIEFVKAVDTAYDFLNTAHTAIYTKREN